MRPVEKQLNTSDQGSSQSQPANSTAKDPREQLTGRAIAVWLSALSLYIVAIVGRTSLGVAGVDALNRFHINASQLAVFTAVQVGVYAFAQIPTGIIMTVLARRRRWLRALWSWL